MSNLMTNMLLITSHRALIVLMASQGLLVVRIRFLGEIWALSQTWLLPSVSQERIGLRSQIGPT